MTETAITYSLAVNFPNGLNKYQLELQIAATNIVPVCKGIITDGDTVYIIFSDVLSQTEITTLNTLIQNYIYVANVTQLNNVLSITPTLTSVTTNMYKRVATFILPATTSVSASSISYVDSPATSYDIIFINRNSAQILLVKNLTNNLENKNDLGYFSNITNLNSEIQVDVSVKKNGGTLLDSARITNITINYS